MNPKKLRQLKRRLTELRSSLGNMPSRKLESFAKSLGRYHDKHRGHEPTYVSSLLLNSRPISIPHHSQNLKKWTANNILDQLEQDILELEEKFAEERGPQNG